MHRSPSEQRS